MKRFAGSVLSLLLCAALLLSPAFAAAGSESGVYSAQLDDAGQRIFGALLDPDGLSRLRAGEPVVIGFPGPHADPQGAVAALSAAVPTALAALELEHPELFWIVGGAADISGNSGKIQAAVTAKIGGNWTAGGRSIPEDEAVLTAAAERLAAEASACGGTYERLLYVHDWLTAHNEYNSAAAHAGNEDGDCLPWTALSALTDVSQPVCQGYSQAFKLVCDVLEIPCILVEGWGGGDPHEWNYVKLDGLWYAVDVTYDDPVVSGVRGNESGWERHDYFLVGADTFFSDHRTGGARIEGAAFSVPELAPEAYGPAKADGPDEPDVPVWPDIPAPIHFADVPENSYYFAAVQWAVGVGVTNGTGSDEAGRPLFSPGATVTRAQAVTFLWRAMREPEPKTGTNPFSDVRPGSYYEKAVLWAVENGVANGYGNGQFGPDDPVTRGQMLTFL